MPKTATVIAHHQQYEQWFEQHAAAYVSELLALRSFVPLQGRGLEIGVGTARFAAPLGVRVGIDPAVQMLAHLLRGARFVVRGWAQTLCGASPAIQEVQPVRPGVGQGAFVVVTAERPWQMASRSPDAAGL